MATSTSPRRLGIYGFRHRKGFAYTEGYIANALSVKETKIWDILAKQGMKVCIVSIPPAYPPTPVNGELISCFITPDATVNVDNCTVCKIMAGAQFESIL